MEGEERRISYACLAGHPIPDGELERLTEIAILDGGAQVRLCREHAAPIASSISPGIAMGDDGA
ncbi:MAG: hypothetical protein JOZ41_03670 [Chloroflexi bacterium]|nr:hypothetical protein [Chloroflexota bacterium]